MSFYNMNFKVEILAYFEFWGVSTKRHVKLIQQVKIAHSFLQSVKSVPIYHVKVV